LRQQLLAANPEFAHATVAAREPIAKPEAAVDQRIGPSTDDDDAAIGEAANDDDVALPVILDGGCTREESIQQRLFHVGEGSRPLVQLLGESGHIIV